MTDQLLRSALVSGSLSEKTAIVSGASSGMGLAHCTALAAAGARVVGFDISLSRSGISPVDSAPDRFLMMGGDVTSAGDWQRVVETAMLTFGSLDILVNNAGIARANRVDTVTEEEYQRVVEVNQTGVFLGMKAAVPAMKNGGGSIINISSTAGLVGFVDNFAYVASKWAVRGMTKAAALELARYAIRVNSVFPGETDTPLLRADPTAISPDSNRFGRWADPREIAAAVVFLGSDESSHISGADFAVDATHTAA